MKNGNGKHGPPPSRFEQGQWFDKPMPHSYEAEAYLIGAVQVNPDRMADAADLEPEEFYRPDYRSMWQVLKGHWADGGDLANPISVLERAKLMNGGTSPFQVSELMQLQTGVPGLSDVTEWVRLIREKYQLRELSRTMGRLSAAAAAEDDLFENVLQEAEEELYELSGDLHQDYDFEPITGLIEVQVDRAHHVQESGNPVTGISTGFTDLDIILAGLHRKNLIILGARPSVGKTALGMGLGQNVAFRENLMVPVFSVEMSKEELTNRVICSEAGVSGTKWRSGLLNEHEWERVQEARGMMAQAKLFINDDPDMSPVKMRHKLRRLLRSNPGVDLGLVVVDYLQLMHYGGKFETRQQEMTRISRELKKLAKEFDVPVLALSQLSRKPEERAANKHRPQLGDLRESGAIEQDADVVLLLYREEMYPNNDGSITGQGEAEVIVAKQRNGPTDTVRLSYNKETTRFSNHVPTF